MRTKNVVLFFVLCICLAGPAFAGTKYMSGSPDLSGYVSGNNELIPGDDVSLTIVIQNTGLNQYKFVQSGIVDWDDKPNTAKFLSATLLPGDAPIIIKSDPLMLGDLPGGSSTNAVFDIKVNPDAHAGTYLLPVTLNYTYLYTADQYGVDSIEYSYKTNDVNITVPVTIKSDLSIEVLSATPQHVNVGTEGYLDLTIKNTGSENGSKAIVRIVKNGNSPIIPIDSSVYVGDFPAGGTVDCRYKVSVSDMVERQTYPVDVEVEYQNSEGDFVTSRIDTIGIPVGGKIDFEIISPPQEMHPGSKNILTVVYKNTGNSTIYGAQARINSIDPFSCDEDIAYLGDIGPGQSGKAEFSISVARAATIKEYGLDSEIRYRDALDKTYISEPMKVKIDVVRTTGAAIILTNPIYLSIVGAFIIGIAYLVYTRRKKEE